MFQKSVFYMSGKNTLCLNIETPDKKELNQPAECISFFFIIYTYRNLIATSTKGEIFLLIQRGLLIRQRNNIIKIQF